MVEPRGQQRGDQPDQIYRRQHHDLADIERARAARKPIGNLQHHPEPDDEAERWRYGGKDEKAFHAGRPVADPGPNRSAAPFVADVTPLTMAGAAAPADGRTRTGG